VQHVDGAGDAGRVTGPRERVALVLDKRRPERRRLRRRRQRLLITAADPGAHYVAGFRAWLRLGYCVRSGPLVAGHRRPGPPGQPLTRESGSPSCSTGMAGALLPRGLDIVMSV
jgi:hypothetical protein